jgi:hypothetical protein
MTEKTDNTEEAVAWRAKNYQGEPWTVAPCEFSKRHYQRIEPLFPLSSLETRDARIAELEGALAAAQNADAEATNHLRARLAEAVGALREVLSIWDQWGSLDSTDPDDRDAMEAARQALSSVGEG